MQTRDHGVAEHHRAVLAATDGDPRGMPVAPLAAPGDQHQVGTGARDGGARAAEHRGSQDAGHLEVRLGVRVADGGGCGHGRPGGTRCGGLGRVARAIRRRGRHRLDPEGRGVPGRAALDAHRPVEQEGADPAAVDEDPELTGVDQLQPSGPGRSSA